MSVRAAAARLGQDRPRHRGRSGRRPRPGSGRRPWSVAHVGAAGGVDQRRLGIGARREVRRVGPTRMRSARLPGSIEPISASRPSARAPPRVAISSTSRAVSDPGPLPHRPAASPPAASRRTCRAGCCRRRRRRRATRRCPGPRMLDDRRDAGPELEVRAGAVEHLDAALGHHRLLGVVDPHAVRRAQPRRGEPELAPGRPCCPGRSARRTSATSSRFSRGVGVDEHARGRATPRRPPRAASREHDTAKRGASAMRMPPVRLAVPAPVQARLSSMPGAPRSRAAAAGASRAVVHQALADRRADARCGASASSTTSVSCTVSIVSTVVVPVRSSSCDGEPRRGRAACGRVRRFERPDAPLQPLEQRQIVGQPAEQRLAQVDVGLDEAGEEVAAAGVDLAIGRRRARRRRRRPRGDTPVHDPHVPGDDRAVVIHREDGGVA